MRLSHTVRDAARSWPMSVSGRAAFGTPSDEGKPRMEGLQGYVGGKAWRTESRGDTFSTMMGRKARCDKESYR